MVTQLVGGWVGWSVSGLVSGLVSGSVLVGQLYALEKSFKDT